jgi:hypothetical protein
VKQEKIKTKDKRVVFTGDGGYTQVKEERSRSGV